MSKQPAGATSGRLVWKDSGTLADGREIIYFDEKPGQGRAALLDTREGMPPAPARREPPGAVSAESALRWDPLLGEWVVIAAHRQERTFLPPAEACPLCPSAPWRPSEIPASSYDVVVFENRFPSLRGAGQPGAAAWAQAGPGAAVSYAALPDAVTGETRTAGSAGTPDSAARTGSAIDGQGPSVSALRPALGRCEVVCFTSDHTASFAGLTPRRVRTVLEAWADRTAVLGSMAGVEQVYCFENRFPSLRGAGQPGAAAWAQAGPGAAVSYAALPDAVAGETRTAGSARTPDSAGGAGTAGSAIDGQGPSVSALRPALGRCEVVCFTSDHTASFAGLTPRRVRTVLEAWADRTAVLGSTAGVEQVYCFENRGEEIGVTLHHPHGQIYAFPFVTPRTTRMAAQAEEYARRHGGNLFDTVVAEELAAGAGVVARNEHWTAFVPRFARWPYEVLIFPARRVPDIPALGEAAREAFCELYLGVLRRFDKLFGTPAPYISAWHQAPAAGPARDEFALHLQVLSLRRAAGKLKYLAGTESGMGVWINDIVPEAAARSLREAL